MDDRHTRSNGQGQGMNWIRPIKRLAIYLRDGLACGYCGDSIEAGAKLTLDHLTPHSRGGSNEAKNLITACHRCNTSRSNRKVDEFCDAVAQYLDRGITGDAIRKHVRKSVRRTIDTKEAKNLIERRGGFTQALQSIREEAA